MSDKDIKDKNYYITWLKVDPNFLVKFCKNIEEYNINKINSHDKK
jgi:hypothetical protein